MALCQNNGRALCDVTGNDYTYHQKPRPSAGGHQATFSSILKGDGDYTNNTFPVSSNDSTVTRSNWLQ